MSELIKDRAMLEVIKGKAFVVGDDIDTDQIIPAKYLSYDPAVAEERKFFGKYAFSGMPIETSGLPKGHIPFIKGELFKSEFTVVIGGKNFGCGSSREHAPLALAEAGVQAVVAQSYARIFYRNTINGAYVIPFETANRLVGEFNTGDEVEIDLAASTISNKRSGKSFPLMDLGDVKPIIQAGGIFKYAKAQGIK
jgi:3-isopropylmalate/(R)-2-methylmalate dehydratase small subunit